jgi:Protein of unknown function (DUF2975)
MSFRITAAAIALLVLAAVFTAAAGLSLLTPLVLIAVAAAFVLLRVTRWRPERAALLLAAVAVATGATAAGVRVANGIADSHVDYHGKLNAQEIRRTFAPTGPAGLDDPLPRFKRMGYGYISSAQGVMSVPRADGRALVLWSIQVLAPWLLAAIVLTLLAPVLRAAERGDPFWNGAARRLTWIGSLLLIGIPGIALLGYVAAETASAGTFAGPTAEPTLTLSVTQILPGVLVLVLAGIFRRGVELRELERHTT